MPEQPRRRDRLPGSSSQFTLTPNYCAQGTTPCTFTVTFNPVRTGAASDTLLVTDALSGLTVSIPVTGTGGTAATPTVSLSPTSLTFAARSVGTTSIAQTVTLTNTGTATLSSILFSLSGTNAGDYTETTTCGSTLAAGANCSVSVSFSPTHTGPSSANLVLTSNASSSPNTVTLSGTGQ